MKADLATTLEGFRTDMAGFREDAERRDRENQHWVIGLVLGAAILVIAVLGILIRWPHRPSDPGRNSRFLIVVFRIRTGRNVCLKTKSERLSRQLIHLLGEFNIFSR